MQSPKTSTNQSLNRTEKRVIRVAIIADEPLNWGSGKHYFPIILDSYSWISSNIQYTFSVSYVYETDILNNSLTRSKFDVVLVPGGGVGDGHALAKGFLRSRKTKKWKKNLTNFIKYGGGYVGICGGAALLTGLKTGRSHQKKFIEKLYHNSSLEISNVFSYYHHLALPIFYPFQYKYPENIGAMNYVFSFKPGITIKKRAIFSAGASLDFPVKKDHPIFHDYPYETLTMRWWGGPGFIVDSISNSQVDVICKYPIKDLSESTRTRIYAWRYLGGLSGLIRGFIRSCNFIKKHNLSLNRLFVYSFYFAGNWMKTNNVINLHYENKPALVLETFPNEHQGRIVLCATHPEYLIWHDGHIEEVEDKGYHCIAQGFHQWRDIQISEDKPLENLTATWWLVRRLVAWAAKIPDKDLPPIAKEEYSEEIEELMKKEMFWDGTILSQINNI